jgi:hypothetical protein
MKYLIRLPQNMISISNIMRRLRKPEFSYLFDRTSADMAIENISSNT